MKPLVVLLFYFLFQACSGQMKGGSYVPNIKHYPFAVQLQQPNCFEADCKCGGAVIAPQWVLTAAHCVVKDKIKHHPLYPCTLRHAKVILKPSDFFIVAGDNSVDSFGSSYAEKKGLSKRFKVDKNDMKVYTHPKFESVFKSERDEHDVALIFIKKPLDSHDFIKMIEIGSENGLKVGDECTVMGWGYTEINWKTKKETEEAIALKHGTLTVSEIDEHSIWFKGLKRDGSMPYILSGDSGSPLVCRDTDGKQKLFGITKSGNFDNNWAIYQNLMSLRGWISDTQAKETAENLPHFHKF